jgi:hypothetical protein
MGHDFVDRREPSTAARSGELVDGQERADARARLWHLLGLPPVSGSPLLADHEAALLLVETSVARVLAALVPVYSRRSKRWKADPQAVMLTPTRSSRYGFQLHSGRNLRAYLYAEILDLSLAEIGRSLGMARMTVRHAKRRGASLIHAFGRDKLDPRRPPVPGSGRSAKNERPW